MTAPKRPVDLDAFLQKLDDEQELDRIAAMTPEQLEEEAKKEGIDPERTRAAVQRGIDRAKADQGDKGGGQAPPAAPGAGNVASFAKAKERRGARVGWVVLALAAGVAATFGVVEKDTLTAWIWPAPAPSQLVPPPQPGPSPEQRRAAELREQALVKIKEGYYGEAEDLLDQAAGLDPGGDSAMDSARSEIRGGKKHGTYVPNAKLPLGPEVPLKKTQGPKGK